jgi:hypothetical protein
MFLVEVLMDQLEYEMDPLLVVELGVDHLIEEVEHSLLDVCILHNDYFAEHQLAQLVVVDLLQPFGTGGADCLAQVH